MHDADAALIRKLRDDGKTLKEIAGIFGISATRIGQLLKRHERCATHGVSYTKCCYRCALQEKIDRALARVKRDGLMPEIRELKARDRRNQVVARRALMVKRLRDRYRLSFPQIGKLLGRDHSSVIHLYYKK
jgi:predicted transcriptional regulator